MQRVDGPLLLRCGDPQLCAGLRDVRASSHCRLAIPRGEGFCRLKIPSDSGAIQGAVATLRVIKHFRAEYYRVGFGKRGIPSVTHRPTRSIPVPPIYPHVVPIVVGVCLFRCKRFIQEIIVSLNEFEPLREQAVLAGQRGENSSRRQRWRSTVRDGRSRFGWANAGGDGSAGAAGAGSAGASTGQGVRPHALRYIWGRRQVLVGVPKGS